MKQVWCSRCGTKLQVYQKALPQFSRVIEVIQPHECTEEVAEIEWDLMPFPLPAVPDAIQDDKFIKKLDETAPKLIPEPGDRRPADQVKQIEKFNDIRSRVMSSAPTLPENEPTGDPSDE